MKINSWRAKRNLGHQIGRRSAEVLKSDLQQAYYLICEMERLMREAGVEMPEEFEFKADK